MARLNTFYMAPEKWGPPYILDGSEARHLIKVLRTGPGTPIRVIDGQGRVGKFTVLETTKHHAVLELQEDLHIRPHAGRLTLAMGWNKTSRRSWILEKAVELEARNIVFWQAEYSQGKVPDVPKESWKEQFIAAAKQCGNPWLPQTATLPQGVTGLVNMTFEHDHKVVLYEGEAQKIFTPTEADKSTLLVIGPEGGFSPAEIDILRDSGFAMAGLGNSILRWETAALLALGMVYLDRQRTFA